MAKNGQVIVTTSGVVQVFSTISIGPGTYALRADPSNGGTYCFIGWSSETATTITGYVLNKGDLNGITITTAALENMWMNSDTSLDVICWLMVEGEGIGRRAPAG